MTRFPTAMIVGKRNWRRLGTCCHFAPSWSRPRALIAGLERAARMVFLPPPATRSLVGSRAGACRVIHSDRPLNTQPTPSLAASQEALRSHTAYVFGERFATGQVFVWQRQQKLLAAIAEHFVVRSHLGLDVFYNCNQDLVSLEMTMVVVDGLETIKIQDGDSNYERRVGLARASLASAQACRRGSPPPSGDPVCSGASRPSIIV